MTAGARLAAAPGPSAIGVKNLWDKDIRLRRWSGRRAGMPAALHRHAELHDNQPLPLRWPTTAAWDLKGDSPLNA